MKQAEKEQNFKDGTDSGDRYQCGVILPYVTLPCHRKYGPGNLGPVGPKLLWENRSGRTILTEKNGPGPGVLVRLVRRCYSGASWFHAGHWYIAVLLMLQRSYKPRFFKY